MNPAASFLGSVAEGRVIVSPDISLATGAQVYGWAHGLPFVPKHFAAVLVNILSEIGYSPGDEIDIRNANSAGLVIMETVADLVNLTVLQRATLNIANKTTAVSGAFTEARWKLRFYIWP